MTRLEDARHGSLSGYKYFGCRCAECRASSVRYEKGRRWLIHCGIAPTVSAVGFTRRVHSLMAIGWTQKEIAAELGVAQGNLALKLRTNETVRRATHIAMSEVYDRLCMTSRDSMTARRTANIAAKRGWPPPLAWDDIDDPDETPTGWEYRVHDTPNQSTVDPPVDPVVIARILAGEVVAATTAERREVVRRWAEAGRVLNELGRLTGWKIERYYRAGEAA